MSSTVVYPVFCPECGEIHKSRVSDTVTGMGESAVIEVFRVWTYESKKGRNDE